MTKTQKIFIVILSMIALGLLVSLGYEGRQAYQIWANRPLGAALPTSPYTPLGSPPTWAIPSSASAGITSTPSALNPLCGGPRVMSILLIGSDTRGTSYTYGLADVTRLVRVDFVKPSVTMLDFPRDLWVKIPYIA
ncbi:MAG TPA: hypothetical protein VLZ89_08690, partial [Anaerolineales bacterium]|nr:hypothetical protein [Anaerolineales bacterium]